MRSGVREHGAHAGALHVIRASLIVLILSSIAYAQPQPSDVAAARTHYQAGVSYYESARYDDAVREFETAYEITPRVELLYNISQCHERLGNLREAVRYLESFVEGTDDEAMRGLQQERLRNLRDRLAEEPEPDPEPDPEPEADPPPLGVVDVPPEPEVAPTTGPVRKAGFALVAVGGAFALTFAVAGGLALAEDSDLADRCATEACDSGDTDRLRRRLNFADASLAIGLVALTAGILMIVLDKPDYEVAVGPGSLRLRAAF